MTNNIYKIKKGEKFPILIRIKNGDEDKPIDLTNAVIRFQLKDELRDEFNVIEKEITTETDIATIGKIINPTNGEVIIRLNDDDYKILVTERVYYLTIWYEIPEENFAKVISSNACGNLRFMVCIP